MSAGDPKSGGDRQRLAVSGTASVPHRHRRSLLLLVLLALILSTGALTRSVGTQGEAARVASTNSYVTRAGDSLRVRGQDWWFVGYNSFVFFDCGFERENWRDQDIDPLFARFRSDGHGIVRLWLFPGSDLRRFDAIVAAARRHNVYLLPVLENALPDCNGWSERKPDSWYAQGWKTDGPRGSYKSWLERVVPRYRNETAIAMWELVNEPSADARTLRNFFDEAGALVGRIDPNHLRGTGTQPPYGVGGDSGYRLVNESPGVDVVSIHEYDETDVETSWLERSLANAAGKPMVVGEFGIQASVDLNDRLPASEGGGRCRYNFEARAEQVDRKLRAYLARPGVAAVVYWDLKRDRRGCNHALTLDDPLALRMRLFVR